MDDNTLLAIIVFGSIFLSFFIPGVIFVVKAVRTRTKRKRCTIPVGVKCTKIEEHYFAGRTGSGHRSGHMSYLPTFVGNVNGVDITYKPKYYSPSLYNDLEVGDRIDILVNPNDHKEWFLPDNLQTVYQDRNHISGLKFRRMPHKLFWQLRK